MSTLSVYTDSSLFWTKPENWSTQWASELSLIKESDSEVKEMEKSTHQHFLKCSQCHKCAVYPHPPLWFDSINTMSKQKYRGKKGHEIKWEPEYKHRSRLKSVCSIVQSSWVNTISIIQLKEAKPPKKKYKATLFRPGTKQKQPLEY